MKNMASLKRFAITSVALAALLCATPMSLGDTLVLSGLSEKSSASTREGVPVLQDIPFVQYFSRTRKPMTTSARC